MKKTGAIPTVNTYVELAHALNTLYTKQKDSTPPKARRILTLIERLEAQNPPGWGCHKGIGVLLNVLYKAAQNAQVSDPEELVPLIDAAKLVWDKADPLGPTSRLEDIEKQHAIIHFLYILRHSKNQEDLQRAADMLPELAKFPSVSSRRCALRIAEYFPKAILAKQYWKLFSDLPHDPVSSELYLLILSRSDNNADEALQTILGIFHNSPKGVLPRTYVNGLLCCVRPPNIDAARTIYQHFAKDPRVNGEFGVHMLLLDIFRKALRYPHILKTHSPDKIYSIIREIQFPSLLGRKDIDPGTRIALLNKIGEIMEWRMNGHLDDATRKVVVGDLKFAKRWREIIRNEGKAETSPSKSTDDAQFDSSSSSKDTYSSNSIGRGRYVFRGGRLVLRQSQATPASVPQDPPIDSPRGAPTADSQPLPSETTPTRPELKLNEKELRRKSVIDHRFMSRIASQYRLRQTTSSPLRPSSRAFSTITPRLRPENLAKSSAKSKKPRVQRKRNRRPVINPDFVDLINPDISTDDSFVSASREDILLDSSALTADAEYIPWESPFFDSGLPQDEKTMRKLYRSIAEGRDLSGDDGKGARKRKQDMERKYDKLPTEMRSQDSISSVRLNGLEEDVLPGSRDSQEFEESMHKLGEENDVLHPSTPWGVKLNRKHADFQSPHTNIIPSLSGNNLRFASDQGQTDRSSTSPPIPQSRDQEFHPAERHRYDPFTPNYILREAQAEVEQRKARLGIIPPKTAVIIRLPNTRTNTNVAQISVHAGPTQQATQSVDDTSEGMRSTYANSGRRSSLETASASISPRLSVRAEGVSSMGGTLGSVNAISQSLERRPSTLEDRSVEVMSMSAQERILLMRRKRSSNGGVENTGRGRTAMSEAEEESTNAATVDGAKSRSMKPESIDVQQRKDNDRNCGVDDRLKSAKNSKKEWSLLKQKGWELIHKAETTNYAQT